MSTTINGFHLFTVKEYSRHKEMDVGSCISSDIFRVGGYDWELCFYPHGEDMTSTGTTAWMFLRLTNDDANVEGSFDVALLNQSGKWLHYVTIRSAIKPYANDQMWGESFMKKSLESSDYLKDDSLTFCCMVEVVQSCITNKKYTNIPPTPSGMLEKDFKYLLDSETGSDIVFHVKDVTFKAHKVILAARSPVFKAQFYGLVGNPALDKVELMDIEPSVFKAMLLFIYSDKLPDSQESMGSMSHMIQHLLVAADRYGLDRLRHLCEAKLREEFNVDVVATSLSPTHHDHCSHLKAFCMDLSVANLRECIYNTLERWICKLKSR